MPSSSPDALGDLERGVAHALAIGDRDRDERHDVGHAHPRVNPVVATQVDGVASGCDARHQRLDQLTLGAGDREHGPVVILRPSGRRGRAHSTRTPLRSAR